jgi:hypothetical protein
LQRDRAVRLSAVLSRPDRLQLQSEASARDEPARLRPMEEAGLRAAEERPMTPSARAEVQRILDAEARRILAASLEGDAIVPAAGSNKRAREDSLDDSAAPLEAQGVPVRGGVENNGRGVDAL